MTDLSQAINEPLYPIAHAAHYLDINRATLDTWVYGRPYQRQDGPQFSPPLIILQPGSNNLLSFTNLVEAHVLRSMRKKYLLKMHDIRKALDLVSTKLGIQNPLATADFETNGYRLFIRHLGELVDLSTRDQTMLGESMYVYLKRIERDSDDLAAKLYPMTRQAFLDKKLIVINPVVSHGRPIIEPAGVSTDIISSRWHAGDPFSVLQRDYGLTNEQIEEAIWFEQRHEPQAA